MNKNSFRVIIAGLTFILGLIAFNLWNFNFLRAETVSSGTTDFKSFPKVDDKENISMLEMSELKVNGIELGTPNSKVLKQFGKPLQNKKIYSDACGNGFRKILKYSGITVELISGEKDRKFIVASVEVTSSKWSVSGIFVGADIKDVQAIFNRTYSQESKSGTDTLFYGNGDGWINFYFKNNKLIKISWEYNFC